MSIELENGNIQHILESITMLLQTVQSELLHLKNAQHNLPADKEDIMSCELENGNFQHICWYN